MDEAKQTLLTQASISRYEERQDIAALMAFLFSLADGDPTSYRWRRGEVDLVSRRLVPWKESFKRTNASP